MVLHWGLTFHLSVCLLCNHQSKETYVGYSPSKVYLRATYNILLNPSNSGAYYPDCLNICRWCLYLATSLGTIYNYIIVIGCAIIFPSREKCTGLNCPIYGQ